jgi:membrane protein implicated in regulation of membrane protease activity/DNA-binding XRE family transcriptional regulator
LIPANARIYGERLVREELQGAGWFLVVLGMIGAALVVAAGAALATSAASVIPWAYWAGVAAFPFCATGIVLVVRERVSRTGKASIRQAADDPERTATTEAQAFGQALYDARIVLGLSVAELALRADLGEDDIERIEEGGTEPTIPLLRRLAAALNAEVRLTAGHDLGSVSFEPNAA